MSKYATSYKHDGKVFPNQEGEVKHRRVVESHCSTGLTTGSNFRQLYKSIKKDTYLNFGHFDQYLNISITFECAIICFRARLAIK